MHLESRNTTNTDNHIITAIVCAELRHTLHVFRLREMHHITCLQLGVLGLEMFVADVPGPGCSTFSRPSLVAVMHCTLHSSTMLCAVHQCIQWGRSRGATVLGAAMTMYTPERVCNTGSMIAQYRRSMVPQYRAQCFSNLGSIVTLSPPQYRASMVLNMVRHDNGTSIFAQLYIELSLSVSIVFLLSFHWNPDPTSVPQQA